MIRVFKVEVNPGIILHPPTTCVHTLLLADVDVILQMNDNALLKSVNYLTLVFGTYKFKISQIKTKVMAFKGKSLVRYKIFVGNKFLEQVSYFAFLSCDIYYKHDDDKNTKIK